MKPRPWLVPALGSAFVLGALVVREALSTTWPWLAYNLVLAWIPLLLGTVAARRPAALALLGVPWLLFLPNAPYLLTDLVHLRPRAPVPLWFDVALLGGTGALGLWMGVLSLHEVSGALARWAGRWAGAALLLVAPLASGFGMYLGRFLRWNSWDLVVRPGAILRDVVVPLVDPIGHLDAWGFTLAFGGLFLVAALAPGFTADSPAFDGRSTLPGENGA